MRGSNVLTRRRNQQFSAWTHLLGGGNASNSRLQTQQQHGILADPHHHDCWLLVQQQRALHHHHQQQQSGWQLRLFPPPPQQFPQHQQQQFSSEQSTTGTTTSKANNKKSTNGGDVGNKTGGSIDQSQRLLQQERREQKTIFSKFGLNGRLGLAAGRLFSLGRLDPGTPVAASSSNPRKIDELRAQHHYKLEECDLKDLPVAVHHPELGRIFHLSDVRAKAEILHGKEALASMDMGGLSLMRRQHQLSSAEKLRLGERLHRLWTKKMGTAGVGFYSGSERLGNRGTQQANKVVGFALAMNLVDCSIKVTAAYLTWSNSLFAEAWHSFLDLLNQVILYYGNRISIREPNADFPYGFGNLKYICSLTAGFGIMAFGCGMSLSTGIRGLINPGELESLSLGIGLLAISALLQGASCYRAYREVQKRAKNEELTVREYLNSAVADPSLKVVLLEDSASIAGVLIALSCVSLTHMSGLPVYDSVGSILIGCLLGNTAYKIIRANALHLVGRSVPEDKRLEIMNYMNEDPIVRKMYDVKATYMGVSDYRFKAEIEYNGREITRLYLREDCDVEAMRHELAQIKTRAQFEEFMEFHGERLIDKVGDEVDRLEKKVRDKYPEIRHMDLESS